MEIHVKLSTFLKRMVLISVLKGSCERKVISKASNMAKNWKVFNGFYAGKSLCIKKTISTSLALRRR